jgi:hypothetical protein
VTFQAPSFHIARVVHIGRALYQGDTTLQLKEKLELSRRFAIGYNKLADNLEFQQVVAELEGQA